ncbi:putative dynein assembly factor 3, axonemal [Trypanosoma grayi]|uniref:putative dynein assembly factor 3, axonemal n=1 Tax=Trypanosoma grayi TaxID=71804 RepID=UPI0004F44055|nr:putative dynein assembly factor 3, axonemal [Trypanosoma grayi]KEG08128.1 putative dynein assembly factor 3, axonemal [Trypanosoma grayi]
MSDKYLRDNKKQFINSIGTELAWGWSPAIDFTEILAHREQRADCRADTAAEAAKAPPKEEEKTNTYGAEGCGVSGNGNGRGIGGGPDVDAMIAAIQERARQRGKDSGEQNKEGDGAGDGSNVVRVLLCGACDIRHIFRTLSSLRVRSAASGQTPGFYHFYIYEPNLRVHCRHLFFLQWLLDSMFSLDELEERVLMFLDAFGNTVTRDTTAAQSRSVAQRLLRVLRSDDNDGGELARLVSFAEMKLKERDFVEEQIVHWARDTSQAKAEETWSQRLRQEMAERYDNRDNIIDWDFNFHLRDYTNLIKFAEYRTWRNTGVAFDATHINPRRGFTYEYAVPNKSLCHFNSKGVGAFLGDMKNGPFFALGAQTANADIRARSVDGTCKYGNGVVSMHNARAWLYGLLTAQEWPWGDHAFAWDDPANYNCLPPGAPSDVTHHAAFPRVRFHFVGLDFARFLQRVQERQPRGFDVAFVGTSCTQFMAPDFFNTAMTRDAVVIAETAKFVVDACDEAKIAFVDKISELAKAAGWEQNNTLTDLLHKDQPEPPKVDRSSSNNKAQKISFDRYMMPHQVALTLRRASEM